MRQGERGGHYVLIQGKKHYLTKPKVKKGGSTSQQHVLRVFENVEDDEQRRRYFKRNGTNLPLYHETRAREDQDINDLLNLLFPVNADLQAQTHVVLDELYRGLEDGFPPVIDHKRDVPSHMKVIVVGDVHGEVDPVKNTITHWYDQGCITSAGHLRDDVILISTGDLVDYSTNSFDVLYAMLKLRSLNPDKVVLLRGNHEGEWWVSGKNTLYDELASKGVLAVMYEAFRSRDKRPYVSTAARWILDANMTRIYQKMLRGMFPTKSDAEIQNDLNQWMRKRPYVDEFLMFTALLRNIGSTMLLLQFEGDSERFAFMHGMWPVVNYGEDGELDLAIWKEEMDDMDRRTPLMHKDACQANFHTAIMWNDLSNGPNTRKSRRGITFGVEIGSDDLHRIMKDNHVKAMVRGHQDLCHTQQGMMTYDQNGEYACANGAAITMSRDCKTGDDPENGWCESPSIVVAGVPRDSEDAARRVLTSSMAHLKSAGYACMGAYTVISSPNHLKGGFPVTTHGEQTPWPHETCMFQRKNKHSQ